MVVREGQPARRLQDQPDGLGRLQSAARVDQRLQALAVDEFHAEVMHRPAAARLGRLRHVAAEVVDLHDVVMHELPGRIRLAHEPPHERRAGRQSRRENLQRHVAAERGLGGEEDRAHAALAELALELVNAQPVAGGRLGRGTRHRLGSDGCGERVGVARDGRRVVGGHPRRGQRRRVGRRVRRRVEAQAGDGFGRLRRGRQGAGRRRDLPGRGDRPAPRDLRHVRHAPRRGGQPQRGGEFRRQLVVVAAGRLAAARPQAAGPRLQPRVHGQAEVLVARAAPQPEAARPQLGPLQPHGAAAVRAGDEGEVRRRRPRADARRLWRRRRRARRGRGRPVGGGGARRRRRFGRHRVTHGRLLLTLLVPRLVAAARPDAGLA